MEICPNTILVPQIFIFMTGVFVSSWIGGILLSIGEWIIKKLPLVKHIYSAAKQVMTKREEFSAHGFHQHILMNLQR